MDVYAADEILGAMESVIGQDDIEDVIELIGEAMDLDDDEIDDIIGEARRREGRGGRRREGREGRRREGRPGRRREGRRERRERREGRERPRRLERARDAARAITAAKRAEIRAVPPMMPTIPGAPPISEGIKPLPFEEIITLDATTGAANLNAEPQAQVRGIRLVTVAALNGDAVTQGCLPVITNFQIGTRGQNLAAGFMPFQVFQPGSFQVTLELDGCGPGLKVVLGVAAVPAPVAASVVTCAATLICQAVT